jgi:hypothetical protein
MVDEIKDTELTPMTKAEYRVWEDYVINIITIILNTQYAMNLLGTRMNIKLNY